MLTLVAVSAPARHDADGLADLLSTPILVNLTCKFLLLLAAPTHAQQATAALWSTIQHGMFATGQADEHAIPQLPSSAAILQQAFIRQPALGAAAAQLTAAAGGRRPASWPCQVAARRAQRQVLQLLAHRPPLQQELALAARMERWAQRSGAEEMHMDSVRRKRKHKMNKVHASANAAFSKTSNWTHDLSCGIS